MTGKFSYVRATSLKAALAEAARPGAHVLAGGTDLLGCLRDEVFSARTVVSISAVQELKGVTQTAGGLRIGALTTLTEVAENKLVREMYPLLAQAAAAAASPQLRNQGTLGGNLCQRPRCCYFRGDFPCMRKGGDTCFAAAGRNEFHCIFGGAPCFIVHPSDTAPALVALDARITIASSRRTRTIPLASFFVLPSENVQKENVLTPGELVTEILLTRPPAGARSMYRKVRERGAFDFAMASAAVMVASSGGIVTHARIVLGGVAPKPWRAEEAEKALLGKALNAAAIAQAAEAAVKDASPLTENEYKVPLVRGILEETLAALA